MSSRLSGRRILVVEDEIFVSWALADLLADLGCVVVGPIGDIDQALTVVGAEPIDAALLDVNLNGQPSYPIADALAGRGVPFAFSTGHDIKGLAEGYQTFPTLQKPFDRSELEPLLEKLLASAEPTFEPGSSPPDLSRNGTGGD